LKNGEKDFKDRDISKKYYKLFANSLYMTIDLTKTELEILGKYF